MSSECLEAAAAAGRGIIADAVWYEGRCNWLGAASGTVGRYQALGPTLYKGTAGVGLFLAHLARLTGDGDARRTAVGALRHALAARTALGGFHVGVTGVAWAAVTAASLLDAPELQERVELFAPVETSPDVMTGTAGTIVGLLALDAHIDLAVSAGETLISGAVRSRRGWSWPTPDRGGRRHLYGLGYGAAGIAWALLELYAASGDSRFRNGAEQAFAYERSWLDGRAGEWAAERKHGSAWPSSGSWCHGEAGLALVHERAAGLLGSDEHRRIADLARGATRRHLAGELRDGIQDLSLCHGATGTAEMVGDDDTLIEPLIGFTLDRKPVDWPGGAGHGTTPGLFRGTSGIAWWLLRIHDRTIASPLALPVRLTVGTATA
jgi:lantibiotic biosynthesis protein